MREGHQTRAGRVWRWQAGSRPSRAQDELAAEEPLEIQVETRPVVVTMRTPGHDEELAAGFLLSEGLVRRREEILQIKAHPRNRQDNVLDVFLSPEVKVDFARLTRNVFVSSSCGLCGKATIEAVHQYFPPLRCRVRVAAA